MRTVWHLYTVMNIRVLSDKWKLQAHRLLEFIYRLIRPTVYILKCWQRTWDAANDVCSNCCHMIHSEAVFQC